MERYFAMTGHSIEMHETEEAAREAARQAIKNMKYIANIQNDGEWPEETQDICWGEIREVAVDEEADDLPY